MPRLCKLTMSYIQTMRVIQYVDLMFVVRPTSLYGGHKT